MHSISRGPDFTQTYSGAMPLQNKIKVLTEPTLYPRYNILEVEYFFLEDTQMSAHSVNAVCREIRSTVYFTCITQVLLDHGWRMSLHI